MEDLDDYVGKSDGKYHFLMCYPGLFNGNCYRFKQSNNPLSITSLRSVSLAYFISQSQVKVLVSWEPQPSHNLGAALF